MKQLFKISNIGDGGLNSDRLPFELPVNFMSKGENFRVRDGYVSPLYGTTKVIDQPVGIDNEFGFIKSVRNKEGDYWITASRTSIQLDDSAGWIDISLRPYGVPEDGQYDWNGSQLGQVLILNNPDVPPQYWVSSSNQTTMLDLPFSPAETWYAKGLKCRSMRAHKNFLIAMNLEGAENVPNGYRISHPADENGLPFTWDETERDSIAIKAQLGGDGGEIVDGLTLRDSFIIYSRNSIDSLTFNPSSEFYWTRREISSTIGLLSANCITEVKGKHYLIVDGDIVVNDGSTIQSILYGKLLRRFNLRTNDFTNHNSFVVRNDIKHEVWFCVPEGENETASTAYIYNWKSDSWSLSELPFGTVSMDYGVDNRTSDDASLGTWVGAVGTWSNQDRPWGTRKLSAINEILASINTAGKVSNNDPSDIIDQSTFETFIERTDIPLLDHRGTLSVTRVYPTATGSPFLIQIGMQQTAGGVVDWSDQQLFQPAIDKFVDIRKTGELLCYRVKSLGVNRFKFSGVQIEYIQAGSR